VEHSENVTVTLTKGQLQNLLFYYDRQNAERCGDREMSLKVEQLLKDALRHSAGGW
jgi:hypothetical protein